MQLITLGEIVQVWKHVLPLALLDFCKTKRNIFTVVISVFACSLSYISSSSIVETVRYFCHVDSSNYVKAKLPFKGTIANVRVEMKMWVHDLHIYLSILSCLVWPIIPAPNYVKLKMTHFPQTDNHQSIAIYPRRIPDKDEAEFQTGNGGAIRRSTRTTRKLWTKKETTRVLQGTSN